VQVEDYYALQEPVPVSGNWFSGYSRLWAERLKILDADLTNPVASYAPSNGWLDGQPAITVHPWGSGMVYYVGAYLDPQAQSEFIQRVLSVIGLKPPFETPDGVEICQRVDDQKRRLYLLVNHKPLRQGVKTPWPVRDHINPLAPIASSLQMAPYGVALLSKEN
jgi:beta-galactosidase